MAQIKLSIIICTYNRASLLPEALDSIVGQKTDFSFETLVCDDCSTDNTPAVVKEYERRYPDIIKSIRQTSNIGLGGNWASGVLKSSGKYLAFLDDDDLWTDNRRMQIMVDYMEAHPDIDVLYTNGFRRFEKSERKESIRCPIPEELDYQKIWEGKQQSIQMDMVMVKKSALIERVDLSDYIRLKFPIQDWNTQILLLGKKARFAYLDLPTCELRVKEVSMSHPITYEEVEKKYERELVTCNYMADQFLGDPIITRDDDGFQRYVNHILATVAFKRGDYQKAKYYSLLSGGNSLRDKCSRTKITFHLFRWLKRFWHFFIKK